MTLSRVGRGQKHMANPINFPQAIFEKHRVDASRFLGETEVGYQS